MKTKLLHASYYFNESLVTFTHLSYESNDNPDSQIFENNLSVSQWLNGLVNVVF